MKRRSLNQSGQALLEYIAIVLISILFIIGIVRQFNDAFRIYLDAWFKGDESGYLFCLIQNGLLPGESEVCSLPSFDLKKGKALAGGIGGVGSSGGHGGGGASSGESGPGGGVGGGANGGKGLVPFGGKFGSYDKMLADAAGKKGSGAAVATGDSGFSSPANFGRQGSNDNPLNYRGRTTDIPITGGLGLGKVKGVENVPATDRDLQTPRFVAAEKARKKRLASEDIDTTFSLGNILKYIVIILICFSIFFFVGSQLVAISRGNKKRG